MDNPVPAHDSSTAAAFVIIALVLGGILEATPHLWPLF